MLHEWESLSSDDLFELHQVMQSVLREKLMAKRLLETLWPQINQQSENPLQGFTDLVGVASRARLVPNIACF